jgi:hypothetical protein
MSDPMDNYWYFNKSPQPFFYTEKAEAPCRPLNAKNVFNCSFNMQTTAGFRLVANTPLQA